jgi:hypothetical protein
VKEAGYASAFPERKLAIVFPPLHKARWRAFDRPITTNRKRLPSSRLMADSPGYAEG